MLSSMSESVAAAVRRFGHLGLGIFLDPKFRVDSWNERLEQSGIHEA